MQPPSAPAVILFEHASAKWLVFERPLQILSVSQVSQVLPALRELETQVERHGCFAAGFVGYEAAPALDPALITRPADGFPLLWFGLFEPPRRSAGPLPTGAPGYRLGDWQPSLTRPAYARDIRRIRREIARGYTYQVNHTFRLQTEFSGNPWDLFLDMLRGQPGGYAGYVDTGRQAICCVSPELFFHLDGTQVSCRPMKGTVGRGHTPAEDRERAAWLAASEKNRAENVMIVDMLRNDLGRVAETGSVRVPRLFQLERYRTLWQMTSSVTASVQAPFSELFAALFPSASITGAPKVSTMRLIASLETSPRHVYTGSLGYLGPGRQAQFNVAIRTLSVDRKAGRAEYGLGGGVVWDSTAGDEYAEALLKARIVTRPEPEFALLETLRWSPAQGYFLLAAHLQRLSETAGYFDYPCHPQEVEAYLRAAAASFSPTPQRVRLLLAADGSLTHQVFPLEPPTGQPVRLALAAQPVDPQDVFLYHKTTRRQVYEQARAARPGFDDVLLYNPQGELTESTIANLVVELGGKLFTPPLSCGLLPGTFRAALLEQGLVRERVIRRDELARCTKLFLVNSVREWLPAVLE